MTHVCGPCGRPAPDSSICALCEYTLRADVADVCAPRGLAYDLDLAITRQSVFPPQSGTLPSDDSPMPYDDRASEVRIELHRTLSQWARSVYRETDRRPEGPSCRQCGHLSCDRIRSYRLPADTLAGIASWLKPRIGWLAHGADGEKAFADIRAAICGARKVIDRPVDRVYAGPCDCGVDLYSRQGADYVTCRSAEHETPLIWDVADRREWLLRAAEEVLATAPVIARALTRYDLPVTDDKIRGMIRRGRITPRWISEDGRKVLIRVGDVLDVVAPRQPQPEVAHAQ